MKFLKKNNIFKRTLRPLMSKNIRHWINQNISRPLTIWNVRAAGSNDKLDCLDPAFASIINKKYLNDIESLETLIGTDLSIWKDKY